MAGLGAMCGTWKLRKETGTSELVGRVEVVARAQQRLLATGRRRPVGLHRRRLLVRRRHPLLLRRRAIRERGWAAGVNGRAIAVWGHPLQAASMDRQA